VRVNARHRSVPAELDLARAYDEALEQLTLLAHALGRVTATHRPYQRFRWTREHCSGCGQAHPCRTLRDAALSTGSRQR
jgi:hypothetical protein